jgi:HEAT repeat protein
VETLIAALKDKDDYVRKAADEALVKIGAPAVEPLIAALKGENKDVRQAAAAMLGRLGWQPGRDETAGWYWMVKGDWDNCVALGSPAVKPLIAALKDKDVRKAAAEALGRLGWEPAQDEMAGWYWMAKRYWGQCVVLGALAVEPLIAALKHKDSDARKVAAEALGEIKDPRAVEPLIAALKDEKWDVRAAAAEALVSLYRNASLSETAKQTILAYRSKITSPHTDDDNWGSCSGHTDSGIGVYFPL